jgi:hypothetical protein
VSTADSRGLVCCVAHTDCECWQSAQSPPLRCCFCTFTPQRLLLGQQSLESCDTSDLQRIHCEEIDIVYNMDVSSPDRFSGEIYLLTGFPFALRGFSDSSNAGVSRINGVTMLFALGGLILMLSWIIAWRFESLYLSPAALLSTLALRVRVALWLVFHFCHWIRALPQPVDLWRGQTPESDRSQPFPSLPA